MVVKQNMDGKELKISPAARLRFLMNMHGLKNPYQVHRATGVARSSVQYTLTHDTIGPDVAGRLAAAFRVSPAWLELGFGSVTEGSREEVGQDSPPNTGVSSITAPAKGEPVTIAMPAPMQPRLAADWDDFTTVPKYRTRLSAGGGLITEEGTTGERYAFRIDWLKSVRANPKRIGLFDIRGNSMFPALQNRDTVLIDFNRTDIQEDIPFAIGIENDIVIKYVRVLGKGIVEIYAPDPAIYKPREYPGDEIRIYGQAVWIGRPLI